MVLTESEKQTLRKSVNANVDVLYEAYKSCFQIYVEDNPDKMDKQTQEVSQRFMDDLVNSLKISIEQLAE